MTDTQKPTYRPMIDRSNPDELQRKESLDLFADINQRYEDWYKATYWANDPEAPLVKPSLEPTPDVHLATAGLAGGFDLGIRADLDFFSGDIDPAAHPGG